MSTTARPARWWEFPEGEQQRGHQGSIVFPAGHSGGFIPCPACNAYPVVYNGNYFCDGWVFPGPPGPGQCEWALAHPATSKRDREICDLIGIDYN